MNARISKSLWRLSATVGGVCCLAIAQLANAAGAFPKPPDWIHDQTIYEVNLRQFSASGKVDGLRKELPRIQKLGAGIIWIMPVNPIGVEGRSGTLGSPYASADYKQFNPEFGTLDEFKSMIEEAHRLGLHVILDWVACHTALDHVWVAAHPDWYKHDDKGQLMHPMAEWKDVAALDYANADMRKAMIDAMSFWIRDVGLDGFRCDTAEWVPLDFWSDARDALRAIKPVFLLAEGDKPELMNYAFDSAYAWNLPANTEGIVKGSKNVADLSNFIRAEQKIVPAGRFRLNFTTNHDKNSWEGTTRDQLGKGVDAFTVLTFTLPGMPLIYNGQEAGAAEHRLQFFEHDPIVWREDPAADLYRKLATLRHDNRALAVEPISAPVNFIGPADPGSVLTFSREAGGDRVIVMLNLSDHPADTMLPHEVAQMQPVLGPATAATATTHLSLQPWEARVWSKRKAK